MLQIRELREDEIPLLKDLAPPEWQTNVATIFRRHFGRAYFFPLAAELDGVLVGSGNGLVQGNTGWLGNIIVKPEYRGRGIGRALTQALMGLLKLQAVQYQVLIASPMGEPIYRKLGFEVTGSYLFFARETASPSTAKVPGVRALTTEDAAQVFALDAAITGERRQPFLAGFLEGGWVHLEPRGAVDGYYLPDLGNGAVIATNDVAGLALMQQKLNDGASSSVVPNQNKVAVDFLRSNGFVETQHAPRMALGPDAPWQPERVYCRGSGYCG